MIEQTEHVVFLGKGRGAIINEVDISVVVPTYNRSEMLRGTIESLIHQKIDQKISFEIIVVDNGSTDSTRVTVQNLTGISPVPIRYIFEESQGDGQARNRGVAEARADWLAFIDDDELAEKYWLKQLYITALEQNAQIVGGAVCLDLSEGQKQSYGRLLRKALRETQYEKEAVHRYGANSLPGAGNVLIKRSVFDSVGLFDTSMAGGGSDSDFVLRAREAGCDLWYTPKAVVYHKSFPNRLTPAYLKWDSHRDGITLAYLDFKYKGLGKMVFFCIARIGQSLLINLPLLVWAYLSGESSEMLGRRILLWRAVGYTRECLFLLAPNIFPQKGFFAPLEFRKRAGSLPASSTSSEKKTLSNE